MFAQIMFININIIEIMIKGDSLERSKTG